MRFLGVFFRWGCKFVAVIAPAMPRIIETLDCGPRIIEEIDVSARLIETLDCSPRPLEVE